MLPLTKRFGLRLRSSRAIRVCFRKRDVPWWAASDENIAAFVRHRYPQGFKLWYPTPGRLQPHPDSKTTKERLRALARARELSAVLYYAFRLCWPFPDIADELAIPWRRAWHLARLAKRHGDAYFAGKRCCPMARYYPPPAITSTNPAEHPACYQSKCD